MAYQVMYGSAVDAELPSIGSVRANFERDGSSDDLRELYHSSREAAELAFLYGESAREAYIDSILEQRLAALQRSPPLTLPTTEQLPATARPARMSLLALPRDSDVGFSDSRNPSSPSTDGRPLTTTRSKPRVPCGIQGLESQLTAFHKPHIKRALNLIADELPKNF
ncbi:hypothetical protein KEM55_003744 [Ascosphaera atra]|nr:hypothetical protein KEM55_003744 [Ascosphaera atra]